MSLGFPDKKLCGLWLTNDKVYALHQEILKVVQMGKQKIGGAQWHHVKE